MTPENSPTAADEAISRARIRIAQLDADITSARAEIEDRRELASILSKLTWQLRQEEQHLVKIETMRQRYLPAAPAAPPLDLRPLLDRGTAQASELMSRRTG